MPTFYFDFANLCHLALRVGALLKMPESAKKRHFNGCGIPNATAHGLLGERSVTVGAMFTHIRQPRSAYSRVTFEL